MKAKSPSPEGWRSSNPTYETQPVRVGRIKVDPCDPNSREVAVVEIDGGKLFDMATAHETKKG